MRLGVGGALFVTIVLASLGVIVIPPAIHPTSSLMGGVAFGSSPAHSAHDPPYEQLLIGLGAGAGLIFRIGSGCHVSVMWHQEGGWLVLT
jgi:hypothetical protein